MCLSPPASAVSKAILNFVFFLGNLLSIIYIGICNLRGLDIIVNRCKSSVFPLSGSLKSSKELFFGLQDLRSVLKRRCQGNPNKTAYPQGKNHHGVQRSLCW